MNQGYVTIPSAEGSGLSETSDIRLTGSLLTLTRVLWIALALLALGLFAAAVPFYFGQLGSICTVSHCGRGQLTGYDVQLLHSNGLSLRAYAIYLVTIEAVFALVWFVVGVVIFLRKSNEWIALFVSFFLITFAITFNGEMMMALPAVYQLPAQIVRFLGSFCFGLFFNLFPDGRFVPRWTLWFAIPGIAWQAGRTFFPGTPLDSDNWPFLLGLVTWVGFCGLLIYAQIHRYRFASNAVQRQQTKWVVFGMSAALLGFLAFLPIFASLNAPGPLINIIGNTAIYLFMLLIPLSISVAILRYRLWDIDILINRTLVYGTLTACIAGSYIAIVGFLGALLQAKGNTLISLLAAGFVAVLFQPLRSRLQRAVNRLMYGERDNPYQVISKLGQRLEATLAPNAVLSAIVETVAQALKLPYVAMTLKQNDTFPIAAAYGTSQEEVVRFPLTYQAERIGELLLAPRAHGETFTPADRRLLADLARQVGVAAHAVSLTTDLKRLTRDLQRSRERLVSAREEERRRLRRDLHDGLGPQLASLTLKLETARNRLAHDTLADTLLSDLTVQTQNAVADIRRLVYALRPPALDELGLVPALREQALQYQEQHEHLSISFDAPHFLPPLAAAVEVAVFRIAQEALTNVVRHAQASRCTIRLELDEAANLLRLEVQDNGRGLPSRKEVGVGLHSMRERAEELGGTWTIESLHTGGTRIVAQLPYDDLTTADTTTEFPQTAYSKED